MLGDSTVLGAAGSSGDAAAAAVAATAAGSHEGGETSAAAAGGGVGSNNSGDDERGGRGEEGDRSFGGNRWPRQETLALLKIRSDMDVAFRDASVKGPLWEEVSRKLAELGYNRGAKKCKEKFENVYKYHKRTKEGRTGKPDGKTYRFFEQLEALENLPSMHSSINTPSKPQVALQATPLAAVSTTVPTAAVPMASVPNTTGSTPVVAHVTVPSTTTTIPMTVSQSIVNPSMNLTCSSYPPPPQTNPTNLPPSMANPTYPPPPPQAATIPSTAFHSITTDLLYNSSSSSTSSDEELEGRRKRKRKWKDFFERLMKEVIDKQEDLQKRFLEAIEKREHDRMVREEAWRSQEMARINREREILAQERSIAAAKDAAVMSFLQKIAEQHNLGPALNNINIPQPQPQPPAAPPVQPQPTHAHPHPQMQHQAALAPQLQIPQPVTTNAVSSLELQKADHNADHQNVLPPSSSRWPKVEVQALIKLRTSLDAKYQESGPKGPLWEEISASMRKIGYNRNSKRCKEKWENINKYFKKVKDSNKKRPEDSKTCPYFHLLDALYKERNIFDSSSPAGNQLKHESMISGTPLMVRPEQQWPPQQEMQAETAPGPAGGQRPDVTMEDLESEPMEGHHEDDDEEDEDKDGDDEDEDDGGCNFEIVASKPASVGAAE